MGTEKTVDRGFTRMVRQPVEQSQRDHEIQYRTLFESASDAIFLMRENTFVECNQKTLEMFGCTREEILAQSPDRFSPEIQPDGESSKMAAIRHIRAAFAGDLQFFEWLHCRLDGTPFFAEVSLNRVDLAGGPHLLAIVRNIDARKRAEIALRETRDSLDERVRERTAELQAANEEVRRFASIISHDLRAPLINLRGFSGELRGAASVMRAALEPRMPELEEEVHRALVVDIPESLDFIDAAIYRMDSLITGLLKLARLGHRPLVPERIETDRLVQGVLNGIAHQIEERQARIRIEPLPAITADRLAMEQIFSNLLDNAVKYLLPDRRGEIRIRAESNPVETVFRIEDNGRGIPAESQSAVFEIFRRFAPREVAGEGMGLAYVQTLVRRHGGRIWCESTPGSGSVFSFNVPCRLPETE
jgi:PAS domain S-box-containing protein